MPVRGVVPVAQLPEVPRPPRHYEAPLHERHGVLAAAADLDAGQRYLRAHPRRESVDVPVLDAPAKKLAVVRAQHAACIYGVLILLVKMYIFISGAYSHEHASYVHRLEV